MYGVGWDVCAVIPTLTYEHFPFRFYYVCTHVCIYTFICPKLNVFLSPSSVTLEWPIPTVQHKKMWRHFDQLKTKTKSNHTNRLYTASYTRPLIFYSPPSFNFREKKKKKELVLISFFGDNGRRLLYIHNTYKYFFFLFFSDRRRCAPLVSHRMLSNVRQAIGKSDVHLMCCLPVAVDRT